VAELRPNAVGDAIVVRVAVRAWSVKVAPSGPPSAGPDGPRLTAPTRRAESSTRSARGADLSQPKRRVSSPGDERSRMSL
jgi:hypothetical protein